MGEVKALPGHSLALPAGEPNRPVIEILERLLEEAKSGQILALAYCIHTAADKSVWGWCPGAHGFHLGAAVMTLQNDYARTLAELHP